MSNNKHTTFTSVLMRRFITFFTSPLPEIWYIKIRFPKMSISPGQTDERDGIKVYEVSPIVELGLLPVPMLAHNLGWWWLNVVVAVIDTHCVTVFIFFTFLYFPQHVNREKWYFLLISLSLWALAVLFVFMK